MLISFLYWDWSGMVYSPTGSSYLFFILGCMTSNFLYLYFSTLYSTFYGELIPSPLLNQISLLPLKYPSPPPPPTSNVFGINKTPRVGFKRGFTVYKAVFTLWVFYSDFSYLPVRCKSSCQVHHHTYPSHIHLALNKMTLTAHRRTHLSINIQSTLLFIQNISPFLIGSNLPANSS